MRHSFFNKLAGILLAVILPINFLSCKDGKVKKDVERLNEAQCPYDYGEFATLDSMAYHDKEFFMFYSIDDGYLNINKLNSNPVAAKKLFQLIMLEYSGETRDLLDEINDDGGGVGLYFTGTPSKSTFKVDLTNKELDEALSMKAEKSQDDIYLMVQKRSTDLNSPLRVAEITFLVGAELNDKQFVYNYIVDDSDFDMSLLDCNQLKQINMQQFSQILRDPTNRFMGQILRKLFNACINTNRNMVYTYKGKYSKRTIIVSYTPKELREEILMQD